MRPLEKIELARAANVPEWLMEPYVFYCRRVATLSRAEGLRLGIEVVLAIYHTREGLAKSRQLLTAGAMPPVLFGYTTWRHLACWDTLRSIWNLALTKPHIYAEDTPDVVILRAQDYLRAPLTWERTRQTADELEGHFKDSLRKFEPAQLCKTCSIATTLINWTNPTEEQCFAETTLKTLLPAFVPQRFGYED